MQTNTGSVMQDKSTMVDVIIVNYNAGEMLRRAVDCLAKQTHTDFQAIIVDNHSTDGSLETLPDLDARFQIVRLEKNTGFAKANNIGAAMGKAPWVACLNPDAFATPNWLETVLGHAIRDPDIVMAGSTQISTYDPNVLDGAGDVYTPFGFAWRGLYRRPLVLLPATGEVFGPCAAAALYRRDAFDQVGGFDEDFFCYHEDVDLAFRLRLNGGKAIQVCEAEVQHVGSGILGAESAFASYHGTRNRSWTFFKNMPLVPLLVFTPVHVGLSLLFLVRAGMKGRFQPTWKGTLDSIRGMADILEKRRLVQRSRKISVIQLLNVMTWSPVRFLTRDTDVRPFDLRPGIHEREPMSETKT